MTPPPDELSGVNWRVGDLERRMLDVEARDASVGELRVAMDYLKRDIQEMKSMVRWMQRTMVSLGGTILAGAFIYVITRGGP